MAGFAGNLFGSDTSSSTDTGGVSQRRSILDGLVADAKGSGDSGLFDKVSGIADAVGLDSAASVVFKGLNTLDLLRSFTLSSLVEIDDLFRDPGDASFNDMVQQATA